MMSEEKKKATLHELDIIAKALIEIADDLEQSVEIYAIYPEEGEPFAIVSGEGIKKLYLKKEKENNE